MTRERKSLCAARKHSATVESSGNTWVFLKEDATWWGLTDCRPCAPRVKLKPTCLISKKPEDENKCLKVFLLDWPTLFASSSHDCVKWIVSDAFTMATILWIRRADIHFTPFLYECSSRVKTKRDPLGKYSLTWLLMRSIRTTIRHISIFEPFSLILITTSPGNQTFSVTYLDSTEFEFFVPSLNVAPWICPNHFDVTRLPATIKKWQCDFSKTWNSHYGRNMFTTGICTRTNFKCAMIRR